jgi:hypothetical protein
VLKHVAHTNGLSSVATLTTEFQTASGSNVSSRTVHLELHDMGFHGRAAAPSLKSPCAMPSVGCSGVKVAVIGLWGSGASPSGSPTEYLVLLDARRTLPGPMHSANCKVWWRRNNDLRLFFMVQTRPLSSVEGTS